MQKNDSLSVYERPPVQQSRLLTYNEQRAAEVYKPDRKEYPLVSNVPFNGEWHGGRVL